MRHFCSTTTKPEHENRGVLAHKGLQGQPEGRGIHKEKNFRSSLFFVTQRVKLPAIGGGLIYFL